MLLEMRSQQKADWSVPVFRTEALGEKEIEELVAGVRRLWEMLCGTRVRRLQQADRIRTEFLNILKSSLINQTVRQLINGGELERIFEKIAYRTIDPCSEVEVILRRLDLKERS